MCKRVVVADPIKTIGVWMCCGEVSTMDVGLAQA
jgi:hypothetical protein